MVASTTSSDKSSNLQEGSKEQKKLLFAILATYLEKYHCNFAIIAPIKKTDCHFVADVILNLVVYKFLHFNKMADLEKQAKVKIH